MKNGAMHTQRCEGHLIQGKSAAPFVRVCRVQSHVFVACQQRVPSSYRSVPTPRCRVSMSPDLDRELDVQGIWSISHASSIRLPKSRGMGLRSTKDFVVLSHAGGMSRLVCACVTVVRVDVHQWGNV